MGVTKEDGNLNFISSLYFQLSVDVNYNAYMHSETGSKS